MKKESQFQDGSLKKETAAVPVIDLKRECALAFNDVTLVHMCTQFGLAPDLLRHVVECAVDAWIILLRIVVRSSAGADRLFDTIMSPDIDARCPENLMAATSTTGSLKQLEAYGHALMAHVSDRDTAAIADGVAARTSLPTQATYAFSGIVALVLLGLLKRHELIDQGDAKHLRRMLQAIALPAVTDQLACALGWSDAQSLTAELGRQDQLVPEANRARDEGGRAATVQAKPDVSANTSPHGGRIKSVRRRSWRKRIITLAVLIGALAGFGILAAEHTDYFEQFLGVETQGNAGKRHVEDGTHSVAQGRAAIAKVPPSSAVALPASTPQATPSSTTIPSATTPAGASAPLDTKDVGKEAPVGMKGDAAGDASRAMQGSSASVPASGAVPLSQTTPDLPVGLPALASARSDQPAGGSALDGMSAPLQSRPARLIFRVSRAGFPRLTASLASETDRKRLVTILNSVAHDSVAAAQLTVDPQVVAPAWLAHENVLTLLFRTPGIDGDFEGTGVELGGSVEPELVAHVHQMLGGAYTVSVFDPAVMTRRALDAFQIQWQSLVQGKNACIPEQIARVLDLLVIDFARGSRHLPVPAQAALVQLGTLQKRCSSEGAAFRLDAKVFTDSLGEPSANLLLSQKRAESIRGALIQAGIPGTQVSVTGFGDTQPVATDLTARGRFANRRVVFSVRHSI